MRLGLCIRGVVENIIEGELDGGPNDARRLFPGHTVIMLDDFSAAEPGATATDASGNRLRIRRADGTESLHLKQPAPAPLPDDDGT